MKTLTKHVVCVIITILWIMVTATVITLTITMCALAALCTRLEDWKNANYKSKEQEGDYGDTWD